MGLGAEETVEVEGDGDLALQRRRREGGRVESGGGSGRRRRSVAEELEIGNEALRPFAGGGGGDGGVEVEFVGFRFSCSRMEIVRGSRGAEAKSREHCIHC